MNKIDLVDDDLFMSSTCDLPSECFGNICSFLELKDCLNLGACSLSTAKQVLPEFRLRRKGLHKRFAYWRDWKYTSCLEASKIGLWDEVKEKYPNTKWVLMPTVQERVDDLYKRMPCTHALYAMTAELQKELCKRLDETEFLENKNVGFDEIFPAQQQVLRAHKLHASILFGAMHSDPLLDGGNTASLEQYMGDVLAIAYLTNQSTLRLVEGSPTNTSFARMLRQEDTESLGYRKWVFMHSSILRVKSFSSSQRERLLIPDLCKVSEFLPNDCHINERFLSSKMTVVLDDFGPLGPAFRGRDVVRLRDIPARRLFAFFISSDMQEVGETTRSALDWLCLVHEEVRKTRPMSVRSPVVRFYESAAV